MDTLSTQDSIMKSAELISKRKRKRARRKANIKERKQRLDQMLKNLAAPKSEESSIEDVSNLENSDAQLLPLGHLEIQTESTTTLLEKTPVKKKRRKKRSVMKVLNKKVDPCCMDRNNVPSNPSLLDNKHGEVENGILNPNISIEDVASLENSDAQLLPLGHLEIQTEATTTLLEKSPVKEKRKKKSRSMKALNNSELIMHVHSAPISPGDFCMMNGPRLRRKLLILDVNGLLADVVNPPPKDCNPDACFARRAIFKRPYCSDFLKFCFERFDVGIWSSRSKKIIVKVVDFLLGNMKHKLLFCWVSILPSTNSSLSLLLVVPLNSSSKQKEREKKKSKEKGAFPIIDFLCLRKDSISFMGYADAYGTLVVCQIVRTVMDHCDFTIPLRA